MLNYARHDTSGQTTKLFSTTYDNHSGVGNVTDEAGLIEPKAYVVLKDASSANRDELAAELQNSVKANAARYKHPRWVKFLTELPKTATGKIQRYKLRDSS